MNLLNKLYVLDAYGTCDVFEFMKIVHNISRRDQELMRNEQRMEYCLFCEFLEAAGASKNEADEIASSLNTLFPGTVYKDELVWVDF